MDKIERQINLIVMLLDAERPRSLDAIRRSLYGDQPSDDAFKRMFERDKQELRAIGVRIDTQGVGAWDDTGYVVRRDETLIPDLHLTPAEHAALMIAAEAWGDGMLGPSSPRMAAMKLASSASEPPVPWILPHVGVGSPHMRPLTDAILRRKAVRFSYRPVGAGEPAPRVVEPHALTFRSAWYFTGFDRDRGEPRMFKLDRIAGTVKVERGERPDFDPPPPADRSSGPQPDPAETEARVAVDAEIAWWVERQPGTRRAGDLADGRVEIAVSVPDETRFVRWAAGLGAAAEVLAPPALRAATASHLKAVAAGADR